MTCGPDDAVCLGDAPADMPQRQRLLDLDLLRNVPTFLDAVRKLPPGQVFRVVMSKENAHLFQKGVNGAYKPFPHNGKHFVENVDLMRVLPDYVSAVSNIALIVNMATLAAKLDAIETGVRDMARLMADTQRGRVKGALDALAREAIDRILDGIKQAGLPDAIRKARLLPFRDLGRAPEACLGSFLDVVTAMDKCLLRIDEHGCAASGVGDGAAVSPSETGLTEAIDPAGDDC